MKQIGMRWPDDLVERIDQARSEMDVVMSRSDFVRSAVEQVLGQHRKSLLEDGKRQIENPPPTPARSHSTTDLISFDVCEHTRRDSIDGVTTCLDCGGKRPYFSWVAPE